MNCMNRITIGGALSFMAVAGCLLYAMFAGATDADCEEAWEDAPAEQYCTSTSIKASTVTTNGATNTYCHISVSSCSITVNVGSGSTSSSVTFTPSWDSYFSTNGIVLHEIEHFDVCFKESTTSTSGWEAFIVEGGCPTNSTDSATAKRDGLPAPS